MNLAEQGDLPIGQGIFRNIQRIEMGIAYDTGSQDNSIYPEFGGELIAFLENSGQF